VVWTLGQAYLNLNARCVRGKTHMSKDKRSNKRRPQATRQARKHQHKLHHQAPASSIARLNQKQRPTHESNSCEWSFQPDVVQLYFVKAGSSNR
jgi:hypothetical protein